MKIGYLCSDVDVQVLGDQGCSVHIREFTNALVDAGHDVFVICSWLGEARGIDMKARVYHLEPTGYGKMLWDSLYEDPVVWECSLDRDLRSILWNNWLQTEGAAIIERESPDFLYERYALFGIGGLEVAGRFNLPLLLELNAPLCDQQEGYQKFPFVHTARQLEPKILGGADGIVALTQWLADWAKRLGADEKRIRVIPDAVSEPLFSGNFDRLRIREQLGMQGNQVVGFVGSFHKWHDVAGLIEACQHIFKSNKQLRLLLVGDGHDRPKLEAQVRNLGLGDVVIFAGKVRHQDVPHYIAAMDVAVVPYQPIEDFFFSPMKLFESMAVGVPTVAAQLGQIAEVVRHGETGWLYPAGDNTALAAGIRSLLEDRGLAARIGSSARSYVLQHHTWRKVAEQVVELARELLAGAARLSPSKAANDQ